MIDVGGQKSPQQVYFGADSRVADPARLVGADRGDRRASSSS